MYMWLRDWRSRLAYRWACSPRPRAATPHATSRRTYSQVVNEYEDKSKDGYSKTDFSIPVGISYEYMNVVLDARYNLGLSKVHKDLGSKNRSFTFSVGYRL